MPLEKSKIVADVVKQFVGVIENKYKDEPMYVPRGANNRRRANFTLVGFPYDERYIAFKIGEALRRRGVKVHTCNFYPRDLVTFPALRIVYFV